MKQENRKYESFWQIFNFRFRNNKLGMLSFWLIMSFIAIGLLAPVIANDSPLIMRSGGKVYFPALTEYPQFRAVNWAEPEIVIDWAVYPLVRQSPTKSDLGNRLLAPSWEHLFGTDDKGMDVFSRIVWGTRVSISIGIVSALIVLVIGTLMGALAGYFGGWIDVVISRFIEIMMCFPTFFLILAVLAFLPPNIFNIMIVIGLTSWTGIARLVRGEVLKVKTLDYVKAAKINGIPNLKIIFSHVLPNAIMPALISATFRVSGAILVESSLSFLGFGVQPPKPTWGAIVQVAQRYVQSDVGQWLAWAPGIAIFITALAYILLGEAIRDAADPKFIE